MTGRRTPRWVKITLAVVGVALVLVLAVLTGLGWYVKRQMLTSGGPLPPAMAAYDVRHTLLEVEVVPETRSIDGRAVVTVVALAPLASFEIHLDGRLEVAGVAVDGAPGEFRHEHGVIATVLDPAWAPGERHAVEIVYGGRPKVALRPPWIDGFVWETTPSGAPWIGVTSQGDGGDDWWPCKDHPSDEPDEGMDIELTVPAGLVGLTNGRHLGAEVHADGRTTSSWRVSYPINNYLVTVNIAPYVRIEERYHGVDGTPDETLAFWALPEHEAEARRMFAQLPRILEVLGRRFGEYPFFRDKLWVAEAPYLGMEHQTLIAYGAEFTDNEFGFDQLLLHELAHEWWGNKVTARDWADFWLHEGFGTYAEALYVLDTLGEDRYLDYMAKLGRRIRNRTPIVQGVDLTSADAYSGDIYMKGAWVLHTLRWLLGDDDFFEVVWRFVNDERFAYGFVETADLEGLVAEVSGRDDLGWFWQRYLRRAEPPCWSTTRSAGAAGDVVRLAWDEPSFELPLPVVVAGEPRRVEMRGGVAVLEVPAGADVRVDPRGLVLAESCHD